MTERFKYWCNVDGEDFIDDKYHQFKQVDLCADVGEQICAMLNELEKEKEYWRDKALKELKEIGDYQENRIKELDKENMEYYHLINCGNCKYHSWDYDGEDEFEVCEKGNNERLMYNKFCKEWRRD